MANEKRLIDANALSESIKSGSGTALQKFFADVCVATAPTVDAVEVPCRMSDTVWGIKVYNHGRLIVKQGVVSQMFFGEDMRLCICVKGVCRGEWGERVFATREEAEAAVEERRTNGK